MAVSEGFSTPGGEGMSRPIPAATTELLRLLAQEASADLISPIVTELEEGYAAVMRSFGVAVQHEADAANTMGGIKRVLADKRLAKLGLVSELVTQDQDDEK